MDSIVVKSKGVQIDPMEKKCLEELSILTKRKVKLSDIKEDRGLFEVSLENGHII